MSDYGYDFSFYLLSQLSEKTSVLSGVTHYRHLCLLVLAMVQKFWISILCRVPLPHTSLEAPREAHICSQINTFLLCGCLIILSIHPIFWSHWASIMGDSDHLCWEQPPGTASSPLKAWKTCLSVVPEVFKSQGASAKWRGINFLRLLSCKRTQ